jgi:sulfopyruvate decarboxylase subunit alpha
VKRDEVMDHEKFCILLKENGFDFYTGVPCSILSNIISYLSKSDEFKYVPATREDEALGIAVGAYLGGKKPVVLMQNSGLGNSIDALTSLVILYRFPILLVISWRGYLGKDAPEHLLMGRCMLDFLKVMNIPAKILSKNHLKEQLMDSVRLMKTRVTPVALILRRGVVE